MPSLLFLAAPKPCVTAILCPRSHTGRTALLAPVQHHPPPNEEPLPKPQPELPCEKCTSKATVPCYTIYHYQEEIAALVFDTLHVMSQKEICLSCIKKTALIYVLPVT